MQTYTIEEGVALAQAQNQEIAIARKKVQAARGGFIEARSGFLPSVASTGFYDKRQQQRKRDFGTKITMPYCGSNRIMFAAK
ncbi:MAG TPA: TolC family protein [Candidatus Binatus sp.]|nr:TolC family protein [Candidatus Binatus sp.]